MHVELAAGAPRQLVSQAKIALGEGREARGADAARDERGAPRPMAGEESLRPLNLPLGLAGTDLEPGALARLRIERGVMKLLVGPPDDDIRPDAGLRDSLRGRGQMLVRP